MNLFDILEGRMQQIFEGGNSMAPLPFKKLAKKAVREMKRSAVKVDGRVIAPSLYTVLVSPGDDAVIAPLYQQVTDELVDFISHEVDNGGYALMSSPMVRFIADPNIKQGRTEVVAEVVTPDVLEALRTEEAAYAQSHAGFARRGAPMPSPRPAPQPNRQPAPRQEFAPLPTEQPQPRRAPSVPASVPEMPLDLDSDAPFAGETRVAPHASAAGSGSCEITDTATGRTWRLGVPSTVIGRDEASADLVLNDTNVSRRHADIVHDAAGWHIKDLGSTNGTRVNGLRVDQADLHSGDTISMGLITLAFKEL